LASYYGTSAARFAGVGNEIQGLVLHDMPDLFGRITGKRPWAFQLEDLRDNERGFSYSEYINVFWDGSSPLELSCIEACKCK
jgi:hypothetical protein